MEQPLISLTFRGSILEAIAEAKLQKKLFVVYTAGDNAESKLLETVTWIDPKVSEALSKYCILLHILEGSPEASNFSAIYPQPSVPCITAVGFNGVQLWQKCDFVDADVLASSLEKAWLSLHLQETTAAYLTAALASGKQPASGTSENASPQQVTQETSVSASVRHGDTLSLDAEQSVHSEAIEDLNSNEDASKDTENKGDGVSLPEPSITNEYISKSETGNASENPVEMGQNNPKVASPVPEKKLDFSDNDLSNSREIINEVSEVGLAQVHSDDTIEVEKAEVLGSSVVKSNDVFLNIRLPDGSSLQEKFFVMDTLKMVKDYINENKTSSFGSFSIAIPYPRKVFNDEDMDSTLSELGLLNRQALIVVPHNQSNPHHRGGTSQSQSYSSNDAASPNASEGYWASVKRILSYANIFSYLSRSDSSPDTARESQTGVWQYSPNPSLQGALRNGGRRSSAPPSADQSTPSAAGGTNSNSKSRQQTSRFGGNIHTLKHDNDDSQFNDRNAFWNGNSTQFGGSGNDDGK
ncbi:hypothetical protein ACS0TY_023919 [Phlomoides rotata]